MGELVSSNAEVARKLSDNPVSDIPPEVEVLEFDKCEIHDLVVDPSKYPNLRRIVLTKCSIRNLEVLNLSNLYVSASDCDFSNVKVRKAMDFYIVEENCTNLNCMKFAKPIIDAETLKYRTVFFRLPHSSGPKLKVTSLLGTQSLCEATQLLVAGISAPGTSSVTAGTPDGLNQETYTLGTVVNDIRAYFA